MPQEEFSCGIFWPGIKAVSNDFFVVWEWDISKQGSTTDDSDGGLNELSDESLLEEDKSENEFDSHDEEEQSVKEIPYITHSRIQMYRLCKGCRIPEHTTCSEESNRTS